MSSYNKAILMGNLCRDPELRYTSGGTPVCTLGLAVNHKYRSNDQQKEEVCFVDVVVWGKLGENCNEYLSKGRSVLVEGRLQLQTWETDGGQKRSKHVVVAENVKFLPSAQNRGQQNNYNDGDDSGNDIPF
jgi:single-strand DNA-binding protein